MNENITEKNAADNVARVEQLVPLCVDLDGTLIRTDLLYESIIVLLKKNFLYLFKLLLWLFHGKARFKHEVAQRVDFDVSLLPYNKELLAFLKQEKSTGRRIILVTASNEKFAWQIKLHTGLFDDVMASDRHHNLSGDNKKRQLVDSFGEKGFDYAGNAAVDLKIWPHANSAIVVNASRSLQAIVKDRFSIVRSFEPDDAGLLVYLRALRIHQWAKNLLIFVPLILAHKVLETELIAQATIAFFAFSLCASSVYVLNDLADLFADRGHPKKRQRVFSAGHLSIKTGVVLALVLLISAFVLSFTLPYYFVLTLGVYYLLTVAYSLWLKSSALIDVITLAGFYTLRIIAGAAATSIMPSFWLLAFSMFIFFSLALVKRYAELLAMQNVAGKEVKVRAYERADLDTLLQSGIASGYLSILVLALYVNSDTVKSLYTYPEAIWLSCPLLLYWISRVWMLARRNEMHQDPVIFAIKDTHSYVILLIGLLILWFAT